MTRVSSRSLWNIIIFRKHSKLGNVFRESFTDHNFRTLRTPATTSFGQLVRSFAELSRDFDTWTSFKYWIDSPRFEGNYISLDRREYRSIVNRDDLRPETSIVVRHREIPVRFYDSKFIQAILSLFNIEKTWNKYRSFCTLTQTSELFAMQHIINRKLGVSLQFRPRMDHLVFFQWMEFTSVKDKKDKRGRIQSRGIEKRALGLLIRRPRIRSLRITGVSSPPNCSPSL